MVLRDVLRRHARHPGLGRGVIDGGVPEGKVKIVGATQKEMTLDLSANHSDCRGSFHEVVGFQHFRNLSFL